MNLHEAVRRARLGRTPRVPERSAFQKRREMLKNKTPTLGVLRPFLTPDDIGDVFIRGKNFRQLLLRERIKLFEPDQGDVLILCGFAPLEKLVINFSTAQDNPFDLRLRGFVVHVRVIQDFLKSTILKVLKRRHYQGMAEKALG